MSHAPVMLNEVLEALAPRDGGVYVDGTFGAGGYTRGILAAADCRVIAIDRDPAAVVRADALKSEFTDQFEFRAGTFGSVRELIGEQKLDGFVLDIGVSSMQIDQAERGFSFRSDGPLDMRMDNARGQTAADIVNDTEEEDLANIIYKYGEERKSRYIARAIVTRRAEKKFTRTLDLAEVIRGVVHKSPKDKIDPATRTFQALRIAVNDELGELERALAASIKILKPSGRLVVVSFHSLEDSIVKAFMREKSGAAAGGSRYMPVQEQAPALFKLVSRKAIEASADEVSQNPRARSAKLRAAEFIGADHCGGVS